MSDTSPMGRKLAMGTAWYAIDQRMGQPACFEFGENPACAFSTISPVRKDHNEDSLLILPLDEQRRLLVVADGVGGMPAGQQASKLVVETLGNQVLLGVRQGRCVRECVLDAIEAAHVEILHQDSGAATTLAVVEIEGRMARTYHIGDSEILFYSPVDGLRWKSLAHSPVGYKVESGLADPDEALFDESRHLVSNVLGGDMLSIEINGPFELEPGDSLLMASDGLFDNLRLDEVLRCLAGADLVAGTEQLISESQRRMLESNQNHPSKPDDLTLISYRWM